MSRFAANDRVRIPADGVEGFVVRFGIGLGDNTPERLLVDLGGGRRAEYFAEACEMIGPEKLVIQSQFRDHAAVEVGFPSPISGGRIETKVNTGTAERGERLAAERDLDS